eukprot:1338375-Amphidinium_carterae.1
MSLMQVHLRREFQERERERQTQYFPPAHIQSLFQRSAEREQEILERLSMVEQEALQAPPLQPEPKGKENVEKLAKTADGSAAQTNAMATHLPYLDKARLPISERVELYGLWGLSPPGAAVEKANARIKTLERSLTSKAKAFAAAPGPHSSQWGSASDKKDHHLQQHGTPLFHISCHECKDSCIALCLFFFSTPSA